MARSLGADRAALAALGFDGKVGQTSSAGNGAVDAHRGRASATRRADADRAARRRRGVRPGRGNTGVAGDHAGHDARAASGSPPSAQAVVEGMLLARYRYAR